MSRIKIVRSLLQSRAEAEHLVGEIVKLQLNLNAQKIEMDKELEAVRVRYETRLDTLQKTIDEKTTVAMAWAQEHPEEFGDKKSIDFVHATIGFRLGQWKVEKTKKSMKWTDVAKALLGLPWGKDFVRIAEPAVDKEGIIAARSTLKADQLASVGINIVQDESFYILPKVEDLEKGIVAA